ncbi:MAG: hypothetical protein M3Z24_07655, partial [Chloroflexota bacterium]|nr:hypothetical protein [Chloroflexota bacterium]
PVPPFEKLNSNDDRMNQVVYANGLLWAGVNTIVQFPGQAKHVGIAYFLVKPVFVGSIFEASVASQGYVAVSGNNVLFPSIGVTAAGKGIMTFTLVGSTYHPSSAYTTISNTGAAGDVHIAGLGLLPDDGFTGYAAFGGAGVARWGDYSAAVADEQGNIWFASEYIPAAPRTSLANWGTFVSEVRP